MNFAYADELRDVKVPVDYPESFLWFIMIGIFVFIGLGFFLRWYWGRKKEKVEAPEIQRSPWEIAFEMLNGLMAKKYLEDGKFPLFYAELSDIIRLYIENRFAIRAPEMTTEEFLNSIQNAQVLTDQHRSALKNFLQAADMVKFAKYTPGVDEAREGYELAKVFIEETKRQEEQVSGL